MPSAAREAVSELGIVIPSNFLVTVRCDIAGCCNTMKRTVTGFDDAMAAVRHLKGWLIADEGWKAMQTKDESIHVMICYKHRREL